MARKSNTKEITIDPVSRLEGEAKISIFLDDAGNVEDAYFQTVELRGFEKFCLGRPAEELPRIVTRICGVCPWAHHMASAKALDALFGTPPTDVGRRLRVIGYADHMWYSHSAHFFALAAPDFLIGPQADPAVRNIIGIIGAEPKLAKQILDARNKSHVVQQIIGGKSIHPVTAIAGGMAKGITAEERDKIEQLSKDLVEFSQFSLQLFEDAVLKNKDYLDLITGDIYQLNTHQMGIVNDKGCVDYYDGDLRVDDPSGKKLYQFAPEDYLDYVSEKSLPWTYIKFPFLKRIGWKGLEEGADSGVYRVGPLPRSHVGTYGTPLAAEAQKAMHDVVGKPTDLLMANHWTRLVEMLNAAEIMLENIQEPTITSHNFRNEVTNAPVGPGIAAVEAPRGTLIHHYNADEAGMVTRVNLIVATTHNNAGMTMSVKRAAQHMIRNGNVSEGILNQVEMAFRAYDPCLACATHSLIGRMPMDIKVFDSSGQLHKRVTRK